MCAPLFPVKLLCLVKEFQKVVGDSGHPEANLNVKAPDDKVRYVLCSSDVRNSRPLETASRIRLAVPKNWSLSEIYDIKVELYTTSGEMLADLCLCNLNGAFPLAIELELIRFILDSKGVKLPME